ncbi:hypothetical protein [Myxococcus landrumensis]|uniref:Major facilitator superfamily (MFS) profile domain-containing protein n=1 Tax=Myxococcus landrumensis TaxID=2813577 RepID=A0ABX7N2F7_9BACT|nr:hypothetical protein [Myxococcus landrumus]QSQ11581.1 hypothetical protein JY572_24670 [Myxococcus landrumus]
MFLFVALVLSGGTVGLTVGVVLDKTLSPATHHGFPGLAGLLMGTPVGALLGAGIALFVMRGRTPHQRLRLALLALTVGTICALGLWSSVLLGIMDW